MNYNFISWNYSNVPLKLPLPLPLPLPRPVTPRVGDGDNGLAGCGETDKLLRGLPIWFESSAVNAFWEFPLCNGGVGDPVGTLIDALLLGGTAGPERFAGIADGGPIVAVLGFGVYPAYKSFIVIPTPNVPCPLSRETISL